MANNRNPGPIGMAAGLSMVDRDTLCIASSSPPVPLSQPSHAPSQPVVMALTRLTSATGRFANQHIQDTQLRTKYLAECKRCIQSLPTLFQQDKISERQAQTFTDGSRNEIVTMQGLIGAGSIPAFHKLLSTIRSYAGADIQDLLHTSFTQQGDAEKQAICLKLINTLVPDNLDLHGTTGLRRTERWLRFMTACLVWAQDAGRMADALTWEPEIIQTRSYRPLGDKPVNRPSPAPRARSSPPPPPSTTQEDTLGQVDQNQQAATLENAAKDGTPFCEECEKARRSQEAEAQGAA